jgi:hypothetical protein
MHVFPVAKVKCCDWSSLAQVCTSVAKKGDGNKALRNLVNLVDAQFVSAAKN